MHESHVVTHECLKSHLSSVLIEVLRHFCADLMACHSFRFDMFLSPSFPGAGAQGGHRRPHAPLMAVEDGPQMPWLDNLLGSLAGVGTGQHRGADRGGAGRVRHGAAGVAGTAVPGASRGAIVAAGKATEAVAVPEEAVLAIIRLLRIGQVGGP